ncbi:MAG: hypothetical protein JKY48_04820 [Flavobacteriales bacterium]|nr:hypothetical protein [Flavobacteriales bacterium]
MAIKLISDSRTLNFNKLMMAITAIHSSLQLFAPLLTTDQFAYLTLAIGLAYKFGGDYMRSITTTPLNK